MSTKGRRKGEKSPERNRMSDRAVIERWYRSPRDYRRLAVVLAEAKREREARR